MKKDFLLPIHNAPEFKPRTQEVLRDLFSSHENTDPFRSFVLTSMSGYTKKSNIIDALIKTDKGVIVQNPDNIAPDVAKRIAYAAWILSQDENCLKQGHSPKNALVRYSRVAIGWDVVVSWNPSKTPILARRDHTEHYESDLLHQLPIFACVQTQNASAHTEIARRDRLARLAQDVYAHQVTMSLKRHLTGHLRTLTFTPSPDLTN